MRYYFILVIISILLKNCISNNKTLLVENKDFYLFAQDSLFSVKFLKISNLDTIHSWTDVNDSKCTMQYKCRIQSNDTKLLQESGFFHSDEILEDTTWYRLTLSHILNFECKKRKKQTKTDLKKIASQIISSEKEKNPEVEIVTNEIFKINNELDALKLQFITLMKNELYYISQIHFDYKKNPIIIRGECWNSNCDDFIEKLSHSLQNLEIR